MTAHNLKKPDISGEFIRVKHPAEKLPIIAVPLSVYDSAQVFAGQEADESLATGREAAIYHFAYAWLILNDLSYAAKAAIISRDYGLRIDQVASLALRAGLGNTLMSAKFYQHFLDSEICPDIESAYACWYDLKDKLLNEDYEAITPDELAVLHDTRHFEELDLPSFAPHLESIAERISFKEDGTDYHFKLEPSLPRLPGGLTGVPVEIRENIYNYFFGDEDTERQMERIDPEKRISTSTGFAGRYPVSDHYLKELGADRIVENPDSET